MIHAIVRLIDDRGSILAEWDFPKTTMTNLLPFVQATYDNAHLNGPKFMPVRLTVDIALPVS